MYYTGFPIKDARSLKYFYLIFSIILPFLSSVSRLGKFSILRNGRLFWETLYRQRMKKGAKTPWNGPLCRPQWPLMKIGELPLKAAVFIGLLANVQ